MNSITQQITEDSQQLKTAAMLTDALFGSTKTNRLTREALIDAAIATANRLDMMLLEIAKDDPHDADIEEAQEFIEGILLNVTKYRKQINAPYVSCGCGGKCDACVAARSDEYYDRKRDGESA